ncbi:glycosyltransferase [Spirosoma fluviale]|uniref:Glycosyltransferase involved in cell wall bisynthesis n=1 Tax=Spirosoma fluviale TaxID=1597977 RepID=A0A286G8V8_9BACT|nr:glycosyltransferase [Spirosoma fluviale]SOD91626.1 Glycosyltransferase involved in cell wall bisynthesis [Spirosoma fluviale]
MNVLHVVAGMDPKTGGVCQAIRTIINGLTELGIQNEVASIDAPDAPYLSDYSFPIHALGPAGRSWQYSAKLVPWLVDNLTRFDTVIVHGLWLYHSYAARKAIQQVKKEQKSAGKMPKVFIMPHGMLDPWFQEAKGRKLKALRNWLYWKVIEDKVVNEADGMLFTCEEELIQARKPFRPYQPSQEINVGYGIDSSPAFTPAMKEAFLTKCPELANQPYLLFLSRIDMKKGVDLLIKAYAAVVSASQHTGASVPKLVIAGPGLETTYGQSMQQLVAGNPLIKDKVIFPGMLTGNTKWGAFYGCEAFVLPSHQENFGIAVVEALACGKPVLISNQVNIWREIASAAGGFVAPNTVEGTRQVLEDWLSLTPPEQRKMEKQARYAFEEYFYINPAAARMAQAISA